MPTECERAERKRKCNREREKAKGEKYPGGKALHERLTHNSKQIIAQICAKISYARQIAHIHKSTECVSAKWIYAIRHRKHATVIFWR